MDSSKEMDLDFREELVCNKMLKQHQTEFINWLSEDYTRFTGDRIHINIIKEHQYRMLDQGDF